MEQRCLIDIHRIYDEPARKWYFRAGSSYIAAKAVRKSNVPVYKTGTLRLQTKSAAPKIVSRPRLGLKAR